MSLLIDGIAVTSLTYADSNRTYVSAGFAASPGASSRFGYLFTVSAGSAGPVSFPLNCLVAPALPFDLVLGHDWSAYFRDMLLFSGLRPSSSFDSWAFSPLVSTFILSVALPHSCPDISHSIETPGPASPFLPLFVFPLTLPLAYPARLPSTTPDQPSQRRALGVAHLFPPISSFNCLGGCLPVGCSVVFNPVIDSEPRVRLLLKSPVIINSINLDSLSPSMVLL